MKEKNNERKIENGIKTDDEEIIDFEQKKLIKPKNNNQEQIPKSHSSIIFILIIFLYKFSIFINRIIQ